MPRSRSRSPRRGHHRERRRSGSRERRRDRNERVSDRDRNERVSDRDKYGRDRDRSRSPKRRRERSRSRERYRGRSRSRSREHSFNRGRQEPEVITLDDTGTHRLLLHGETEQPKRPENAEEEMMQQTMGFCGFDSSKGKQKFGAVNAWAVNLQQKRKYRQYMNRKGGFNRPLDPVA